MAIFYLQKKWNSLYPRLTTNGLELREGSNASAFSGTDPPVITTTLLKGHLIRDCPKRLIQFLLAMLETYFVIATYGDQVG